ncbi:MAG: response regulator transcription factor [Bacteroidota bacterium]|nr:response regulator transcription factor [Bacteroidota bacterium]
MVDDHPIFRKGLKNVLIKTHLVARIFEAGNGLEAIELIKKEAIDLVMMDIDMPEMNGVEATAKILKIKPSIKIIALTMYCEPKYVYELCKKGAKGYLLKDSPTSEICKAINMVLTNQEYYSSKVQSILVKVYRDYDKELPKFDTSNKITKAQKEVLILLCQQNSTEDIAQKLHISSNTVNRHRQDLLYRTGSINLAGLVIYAIEHELIEVSILHTKNPQYLNN